MKLADELVTAVAQLEPRLQQRLSRLHITWTPDGPVAQLSFALLSPVARRLDADELPDGVTATAWERWPDMVVPLATEPDLRAQLRALEASGLVGRLDACRYDAGAGAADTRYARFAWIVTTHASSARERRDWLLAARQQL